MRADEQEAVENYELDGRAYAAHTRSMMGALEETQEIAKHLVDDINRVVKMLGDRLTDDTKVYATDAGKCEFFFTEIAQDFAHALVNVNTKLHYARSACAEREHAIERSTLNLSRALGGRSPYETTHEDIEHILAKYEAKRIDFADWQEK